MLLNIDTAEFLQAIQPILFLFSAIVLIFYMILFLMPGSNGVNNWGQVRE
jgi:hypothetical protein